MDDKKIKRRVTYYDDLLQKAQGAGYQSYADALIGLYALHKSSAVVAKVFGLHRDSVLDHLRIVGGRILPRGGARVRAGVVFLTKEPCSKCGEDKYYTSGKCVACHRERMRRAKREGK